MAQVALTPIAVTSASAVLTSAAANAGSYPDGGNRYPNTQNTALLVNNGDASSHTMTVTWLVDGVPVTRSQAIAAGVTRVFRFNPAVYGAQVNIQFDAVTDVTVSVINL